jgi:hypothetical protein
MPRDSRANTAVPNTSPLSPRSHFLAGSHAPTQQGTRECATKSCRVVGASSGRPCWMRSRAAMGRGPRVRGAGGESSARLDQHTATSVQWSSRRPPNTPCTASLRTGQKCVTDGYSMRFARCSCRRHPTDSCSGMRCTANQELGHPNSHCLRTPPRLLGPHTLPLPLENI